MAPIRLTLKVTTMPEFKYGRYYLAYGLNFRPSYFAKAMGIDPGAILWEDIKWAMKMADELRPKEYLEISI